MMFVFIVVVVACVVVVAFVVVITFYAACYCVPFFSLRSLCRLQHEIFTLFAQNTNPCDDCHCSYSTLHSAPLCHTLAFLPHHISSFHNLLDLFARTTRGLWQASGTSGAWREAATAAGGSTSCYLKIWTCSYVHMCMYVHVLLLWAAL